MTAPVQPDTTVDDQVLAALDFAVRCVGICPGAVPCDAPARWIVLLHCPNGHAHRCLHCDAHVGRAMAGRLLCTPCRREGLTSRSVVDSIETLR